MSKIKCAVSHISTIINDEEAKRQFQDLVKLQWMEVDHRRKSSNLDVDFNQYLKLEELGTHFIVVTFSDEELVGYNSMFVSPSPHTKELTALTDTVYIKKEYRKEGLGGEMIRLAEEEAKARGAQHMMVTFKNGDSHPNIVEDLGFFSYETIYAKYIGG